MDSLLEKPTNHTYEGEIIMSNNEAKIIGRILVSGQLETISPLMISQGDGTYTDSDIVLDGKGQPFIPGTSWAGAIREHYNHLRSNLLNMFFGDAETYQSAVVTQDLFIVGKATKEIRTNTKIDSKTQTAKDKSLHNYEVLSAGNLFDFGFEVVLRSAHESYRSDIIKLVKSIIYDLQNEHIRLGAKTNSGFGRVKLINAKYRDLSFPDDSEWWFISDRKPTDSIQIEQSEIYDMKKDLAIIHGIFKLDGSILIRQDYTGDDENIDSEQMTSNNKSIIPGTSLKGVIRHRAEKILQTMNPEIASEKIKNLFGYVDNEETNNSADPIKGRISVGEAVIKGGVLEKQTRIKVDMFTGGAMDGALFSEMPLWDDGNTSIDVDIKIKEATEFDVALILQVMKDLWTGNLRIGGEASIGRGRFTGKKLSLEYHGKSALLKAGDEGIKIDDRDELLPLMETAWKNEIKSEEVSA